MQPELDVQAEHRRLERFGRARVDEVEQLRAAEHAAAPARVLVVVLVERHQHVERVDDLEAHKRRREQLTAAEQRAQDTRDEETRPRRRAQHIGRLRGHVLEQPAQVGHRVFWQP